jgi:hypothetical protein
MAIFKPGPGFDNSKVVDKTQLISRPGKSARMQLANNNFNSSSPGFQQLDQIIRSLDALYDLLPIQEIWDAYSGNISPEWNLCANCQPDQSGKKLFRQYNFNRRLIGLPTVELPIDDTERCLTSDGSSHLFSSGVLEVQINTDAMVNSYLVFQAGDIMSNPVLYVDNVNFVFVDPALPVYQYLAGQIPGTVLFACTFNEDGAPGKTVEIEIV